MKNFKLKVKIKKSGVKIFIQFSHIKNLIDSIKKKLVLTDECKYCGGELEVWGSKDAICKNCGKKTINMKHKLVVILMIVLGASVVILGAIKIYNEWYCSQTYYVLPRALYDRVEYTRINRCTLEILGHTTFLKDDRKWVK